MTKPLYLAGPMSGYPKFNFPLFEKAAQDLRDLGFDIISPAELDKTAGSTYEEAIESLDGDVSKLTHTWGDFLSRDVKIVADQVEGIVFLPNWQSSKGARLEAYVALQTGHNTFYRYIHGGEPWKLSPSQVIIGVAEGLYRGF